MAKRKDEKNILTNIKNKLVHSKKKAVYATGHERTLSSEELNAKRINELIRRMDKITTDLYTRDSEYALRQIPELKKKLDKLAKRLSANDDDFRIFRDTVASLEQAVNTLVEASHDK